ncbi:MAG: FecR family protein [Planctomycetota bacterium]|jgi:hypothetical protein|nr:FecR family protein [Planctomycetota bacterium]
MTMSATRHKLAGLIVGRVLIVAGCCLPFWPDAAGGGEHWSAPGDPGVVETGEAGRISDLAGKVEIGRAGGSGREKPVEAGLADRLRAGDELTVPAGGRLEWKAGGNTVITVGPNSRLVLEGTLGIPLPGGAVLSRRSFRLLQGEARIQVRLNLDRPEGVLARLSGADFLLLRGDVSLNASGGWNGAALSGGVEYRPSPGSAILALDAGGVVNASGPGKLSPEEAGMIRERLPFSFELAGFALPPSPARGEGEGLDGP